MTPSLRSVSSNPQDPPYPAKTKANGFKPEVDWRTIKSSRTWRMCPTHMRNALLRLWLESWEEVPCGSWEDDEALIAAAIDLDEETLHGYRKVLLCGWVRHADGRLYHPHITEMVLQMLESRKSVRDRQNKWRENKRIQERNALLTDDNALVTCGTGTGTGTGNIEDREANASLSFVETTTDRNEATPASPSEQRIPNCPHAEILAAYRQALPELPQPIPSRWPTSAGAQALRARWGEDARHRTLEFWRAFFSAVRSNPHWMGANDREWRADLPWLVKRANFDKVLVRIIAAKNGGSHA